MNIKPIEIVLVVLLLIIFGFGLFKAGYENGQLDALDGKQHLHYETNNVQRIIWKYNK